MQKTFNYSYNTTFEKCKQSLSALDISIDSEDKINGVIQASTGTSLLSWGENIHITIRRVDSEKTKVTVVSEATAQLISWGKNEVNAEKILLKMSNS